MAQEDNWDYSEMSGWFDADIVAEFKEAKENATWPHFTGSAPYIFPRLHTLSLDVLDIQQIGSFTFPSLCQFDITCGLHVENLDPIRDTLPSSLTHVVFCGGNVSIPQILSCFPHLRHLTLTIEYGDYPSSTYDICHPNLEVIELAAWRDFYRGRFVDDILRGIRDGKLPGLREIQLTRPCELTNVGLPFEECNSLGVILSVCVRKRMHFGIMTKRHYV